ncbi:hypothetical protein [Rhodococcus jostii]|uniref:hypothetical protein n=1 Tax=Rhodococcus jostii TaxID=132919 RepID=UPI0036572CDF
MGTISWMRGAGPLVPFAEGFEEELRRLGHRPGAVRHHMVLMGQLDRWLTGEGLAVEDLSIAQVEGFLASRRARWSSAGADGGDRGAPVGVSAGPAGGTARDAGDADES